MKSRSKRWLLLLLVVAFSTTPLTAERGRPFKDSLFSPELLIANQRKIGLTAEQRAVFVREMQRTQSDLLPAQLEMSEASADLLELLAGSRIDEQAALDAARRVLALEQQVKRRHMVLLIRIKNLLTEEQQRLLREIRDAD